MYKRFHINKANYLYIDTCVQTLSHKQSKLCESTFAKSKETQLLQFIVPADCKTNIARHLEWLSFAGFIEGFQFYFETKCVCSCMFCTSALVKQYKKCDPM